MKKIKQSELIIFASPIYWWGVTGIMKKPYRPPFIFTISPDNKEIISGKKAIVIAPMNMNKRHLQKPKYLLIL